MCETRSNLEDESLPLPTSLSFFVFTVEGGKIQQASSGIEAWLLFSDKTCYHIENNLFYACNLPHIV